MSEFRDAGLNEVREELVEVLIYEPTGAAVSMVGNSAHLNAVGLQFTQSDSVEGLGLYVGEANSRSDLLAALERLPSITNRVVVVRSYFPFLLMDTIVSQGALGVIIISMAEGGFAAHYTAMMYPSGEAPGFDGRPMAIPGVTITRDDGDRLVDAIAEDQGGRIRVDHSATYRKGTSANVVGVVPGRAPHAGHVILGAHHDTQLAGVGACDNGTGLATLVAAARLWSRLPTLRTCVFVAFADEEHGLYGSTAYCRRHVHDLWSCAAMFNLDVLAWSSDAALRLEADPALRRVAQDCLDEAGWSAHMVDPSAIPGADHVPFIDTGVPAAWLWRYPPQHPFFHTAGDVIDLIDMDVFADAATAAVHLARSVADLSEDLGRSQPSRRWMDLRPDAQDEVH